MSPHHILFSFYLSIAGVVLGALVAFFTGSDININCAPIVDITNYG